MLVPLILGTAYLCLLENSSNHPNISALASHLRLGFSSTLHVNPLEDFTDNDCPEMEALEGIPEHRAVETSLIVKGEEKQEHWRRWLST